MSQVVDTDKESMGGQPSLSALNVARTAYLDEAGRFGATQSREAMRAMYTEEPLFFDLAPEAVEPFFAARGFTVVEHLSMATLEARYLTLPDGSLAGRMLDLFGLVQSVVRE